MYLMKIFKWRDDHSEWQCEVCKYNTNLRQRIQYTWCGRRVLIVVGFHTILRCRKKLLSKVRNRCVATHRYYCWPRMTLYVPVKYSRDIVWYWNFKIVQGVQTWPTSSQPVTADFRNIILTQKIDELSHCLKTYNHNTCLISLILFTQMYTEIPKL